MGVSGGPGRTLLPIQGDFFGQQGAGSDELVGKEGENRYFLFVLEEEFVVV